jgi:hypothetical protein
MDQKASGIGSLLALRIQRTYWPAFSTYMSRFKTTARLRAHYRQTTHSYREPSEFGQVPGHSSFRTYPEARISGARSRRMAMKKRKVCT